MADGTRHDTDGKKKVQKVKSVHLKWPSIVRDIHHFQAPFIEESVLTELEYFFLALRL